MHTPYSSHYRAKTGIVVLDRDFTLSLCPNMRLRSRHCHQRDNNNEISDPFWSIMNIVISLFEYFI